MFSHLQCVLAEILLTVSFLFFLTFRVNSGDAVSKIPRIMKESTSPSGTNMPATGKVTEITFYPILFDVNIVAAFFLFALSCYNMIGELDNLMNERMYRMFLIK